MITSNNTDLTAAELDWVYRAIRHRKAQMCCKIISVVGTIFVFVWLPILLCALAIWADEKPFLTIEKFRDLRALDVGALVMVVLILSMAVLGTFIAFWREWKGLTWIVKVGLKAFVPDQITVRETKAAVSTSTCDDTHTTNMVADDADYRAKRIQIPAHWRAHLEFQKKPFRLIKVSASGEETQIRSIIRGGMSPSGMVMKFPVTTSTFSDAHYVALSIGDFSIDAEIKAGLPKAYFQSEAAEDIARGCFFLGLFMLYIIWIGRDNYEGLYNHQISLFSIGALMLLPIFIMKIRIYLYKRKIADFYKKKTQ